MKTKTVETETELKIGDQVMITRDQTWPGVAKIKDGRQLKGKDKKLAGLVPMGSMGTLRMKEGVWIIVFNRFPADPEWPCVVAFYPAKLPEWVVRAGTVQLQFPTTETKTRQDDWTLLAQTANM